ncbi:MetQ/NlpA family ABC transporter substrate-binding protein [uncultured Nostoc sp.]|uniref:MetQ/NlpA family ABC transporter substrate-binding protein n=1 Tax=uncultured Nostoc sp. TaxID=340711 RepID=UPI00260AE8B0|nr:MetQ/NlpA family ABC transporter substrate-binding protein [uncultured Nostoc sp.]
MNRKRNSIILNGVNRRYFILVTSSAIASIVVASCTSSQNSSSSTPTSQNVSALQQTSTIKIGVWSIIAEDILKFIQKDLASSQGLDIQIIKFSDWVQVNNALKSGEIDANYFQHRLFMEDSAKRLKLNLVMLNQTYLTPVGIYSKKFKSLNEVPNGATTAIQNDASNQDRTLKFLQAKKLIKLKETSENLFTVKDIVENPKNLQFKELKGPVIVRGLDDVDLGAFLGSLLIQAKQLDLRPLAQETTTDKRYALGLVTLQGKENDPRIQKLNQLIVNPKVKDFIKNTYKNAVLAVF